MTKKSPLTEMRTGLMSALVPRRSDRPREGTLLHVFAYGHPPVLTIARRRVRSVEHPPHCLAQYPLSREAKDLRITRQLHGFTGSVSWDDLRRR